MDWDKAKNMLIIFLLVLNSILGVLVYQVKSGYQVTQAQEKAIRSLLSQNRISMYAEIIKEYTPKKEFVMSAYGYDRTMLTDTFFGSDEYKITSEYNKTIYRLDDARLAIQNGYITYEKPSGSGSINLARDTAIALCADFIKKMGREFETFRLDRETISDDSYTLEYREVYKNNIIYSNFIEFTVTKDGIIRIELMYYKTEGYSNQPAREICPADEALFAFLQRMSGINSGKEIFINKMDMVYLQEESGYTENASYKATPYYRIYINENDTPFLINAYFNTVI